MSGPELFDVGLEAATRRYAGAARSEGVLEATRVIVRPHVEAAMRDVLRRRFELVEHLRDTVEERLAAPATEPSDARFLDGVEFGLAWAALTFGVEVAAAPQRATELPAWLKAHRGER